MPKFWAKTELPSSSVLNCIYSYQMLSNMESKSLLSQIELIASYLTLHRREDDWTVSLTKDLKISCRFSDLLLSGIEFLIPWISSDAVLEAGDTSLDWKDSINSDPAISYAGGTTLLQGVLFFLTLGTFLFSKDITHLLEEMSLKCGGNLECKPWWALLGKLVWHNQSEIKDLAGGDFSYFSGIYCQNYGCFWK